MKIMRREFTLREKILLVLLAVILLGGLYYYLVDQPVRKGMAEAQKKQSSLQKELKSLQQEQTALSDKKKELDYIMDNGIMAPMGSYNNEEAELKELNDILQQTVKYEISFTKSTREGSLVRKYFALNFTTESYQEAEELLIQLNNCPLRCLISDIRVSATEKAQTLENSRTEVSLNAAFYETMYEGTVDLGLPADTGKERE